MRIHREGHRIIIVTILLLAAILGTTYYFLPVILPILLVGAIVLMGLMLNFFRNPERSIPKMDSNLIYSPADGHVVVLEEVQEQEYFKDRRLQMSIFMSIYDVHANRMPIGGDIVYYHYHEGKYLLAKNPKSSLENERNTVVVKNGNNVLLFRQLAGAVARRIRPYIQQGDKVQQGQEMGFIRFGSRVDIFFPLDTKIEVKIGDKVTAGESLLGCFTA
ncbi:MAG: phosphatidylserine decarboxylase family protein [Bacteroidota bacterium]